MQVQRHATATWLNWAERYCQMHPIYQHFALMLDSKALHEPKRLDTLGHETVLG